MGTPPASPTGPRFGNSPDSGRPPAETTPGGRPDTTAPAESVSTAGDVDRGDRPSGGREQPRLGLRRGVVIDVALPVTSVNPVIGSSPELAVVLVLHRAHGGGVVKLGADYLDQGLPAPGCLAGAFDELTGTGLLALADPGPEGRRQVTLTTASLNHPASR